MLRHPPPLLSCGTVYVRRASPSCFSSKPANPYADRMNVDRNLRTRTSRLLLALPVAAVALSLAACSAPVERPSSDKVADGIQQIFEDGGLGDSFTEAQITCIADMLVDSDVSDQDLANIADGKDVQTSAEAAKLVEEEMTVAAQECLTAE